MGEQHDERGLAHVGGFAAHVRSGDDEHAPRLIEIQIVIVGDEGLIQASLHHRVAPGDDVDPRRVVELRLAVIQRIGALGKVNQHVELGERAGGALKRRQRFAQRVQQPLVENLLPRQRALAGAQDLVLEGLQLLGHVALRALERLAANVVGGRAFCVGAPELDVVAVHPVVADFEGADSGALPFALFQIHQKLVGVGAQAPELVQLRVIAIGDHAAVANQHRRGLDHGLFQQRAQRGKLRRALEDVAHQRRIQLAQKAADVRQHLQRGAQLGQIPRPRRAQRHPGKNPLQIADFPQQIAQGASLGRLDQRADAVMAKTQAVAIAKRRAEPAPKQAAAHGGGGVIDDVRQGPAALAAQAAQDFQIAAGVGVENDAVLAALEL